MEVGQWLLSPLGFKLPDMQDYYFNLYFLRRWRLDRLCASLGDNNEATDGVNCGGYCSGMGYYCPDLRIETRNHKHGSVGQRSTAHLLITLEIT